MLKRTLSLTVALVASMLLAGTASAVLEVYEKAFEASTMDVTIPTSATASILVRHCPSCQAMTLSLTAATTFYIGKTAVTLQEFREWASSSPRGLTILYFPESGEVSRMIVSSNQS